MSFLSNREMTLGNAQTLLLANALNAPASWLPIPPSKHARLRRSIRNLARKHLVEISRDNKRYRLALSEDARRGIALYDSLLEALEGREDAKT